MAANVIISTRLGDIQVCVRARVQWAVLLLLATSRCVCVCSGQLFFEERPAEQTHAPRYRLSRLPSPHQIRLRDDAAPRHAAFIRSLVGAGKYTGCVFYRYGVRTRARAKLSWACFFLPCAGKRETLTRPCTAPLSAQSGTQLCAAGRPERRRWPATRRRAG